MTIVGLPETTVAPLVRAVAGDGLDIDGVAERFARSAWCAIAEPGDGDAGLLIATFGARGALQRVVDRTPATALAAEFAERGLDAPLARWEEAVRRWAPRVASAELLRGLSQAARFGCRLLVPDDEFWPAGVDDLQLNAPHALWARGDVSRLAHLRRSIAIVGARAATGYGEHVTVEAASGLVDRGFAIVSGAAYGIDGVAHRAALASQGTTVAVLAGGLDRFYPSGHEQLLTRIVDRGVVLAEVPCATAPTRWRFLLRNRLIAAMSNATVVVEAGSRSGSINTAKHANDLSRPLAAVPGPVTSSASAGCHWLIREYAAICVTTPDEMAELVPLVPGDVSQTLPVVFDDDPQSSTKPGNAVGSHDPYGTRLRVLDALSAHGGRSAQKVAALSGLALDRVRAELGLLELEGLAREMPSGWMRQREASTPKNRTGS